MNDAAARSVLFMPARMRRRPKTNGRICSSTSGSLVARAGGDGVDGREDAAGVGQVAVELELHVAGALELLKDDLVHLGAGVDEGGGEDGERAAVFDVAGRAQETLGRIQGRRINAARQDTARGGMLPGCRRGQDA